MIKGNQIIITSSSESFNVFVVAIYLIRTGLVLPILVDVRLMCGCTTIKVCNVLKAMCSVFLLCHF